METSKYYLETFIQTLDAYKTNDSSLYYKAKKNMVGKYFLQSDIFAPHYKNYKVWSEGSPSEFAKISSELLYEKAYEWRVAPIVDENFYYSAYDKFYNKSIRINELERFNYSTTSSFLLYYKLLKLKDLYLYFTLAMIILVCAGYTNDKEEGQQIYMIQTQPINRYRYHFAKIIAGLLIISLLFFNLFIGIAIVGFFLGGMSGWNFPVIEYTNKLNNYMNVLKANVVDSISFIPMWKYFIRLFVITILNSIFIMGLSNIISIFVKDRSKLLIILLGILTSGYFLINISDNEAVKGLLPFIYLNVTNVSDLSFKILFGAMDLSFYQALLIIGLWASIVSLFGAYLANKIKQRV